MNTKPIDWDHLAKYTLGDGAIEQEILALFVVETVKLLEKLRAADDQDIWTVCCHTIKGSARGVGASHLGDLAAAAEEMPWPSDSAERERHRHALKGAFDVVDAHIRDAFSEPGSRANT